MTAVGGGTDGREPGRAPAGGRHKPAGGSQLAVAARGLATRTDVRIGAIAVTALLVGVLVGGGLSQNEQAAATPPPARPPAPESVLLEPGETPAPAAPVPAAPDSPAAPDGPQQYPVADPVSISIPEMGIDQYLIGLRVSPDGTMQAPQEWNDIGWWAKGPAPGESGGAVIAGHVNGGGQPAVFSELPKLPDGAEIVIDRSDGTTATYRVTSRQQFPKDDFPDDLVYTFEGPTALHLVTCGGQFDQTDGHYEDNIVVFAELVSDTSSAA